MGKREELEDLKRLLIAGTVVVLTWVAAFGWRPGVLNSRYDNIQLLLPFLRELFAAGGDWSGTIYRIEWLGGSYLSPVTGAPPLYSVFARLGFSTVAAANAAGLMTQIIHAFFGTRMACDLAELLRAEKTASPVKPSWLWLVGVSWLTAFVPVLGWRFAYGDALGIFGGLMFLATVALFTAGLVRRQTLVQSLVALVAYLNAIPSLGQQHILFGAVFGAPILVGLALMNRKRALRACALPLVLGVGALGLSLPIYVQMLSYAASTDAPRSQGAPSLTYSNIVSSWRDWLSSLTWGNRLIPVDRPPQSHHETNYPIGPLVLLLALLPLRKAKPLLVGFGVSVLAAVLFGSGVEPVGSWLQALIPPLKLFREPMRAIRPAYFLLPVIAVAALTARERTGTSRPLRLGGARAEIFAALGAVALFAVPSGLRELVCWLGVGFVVMARAVAIPAALVVFVLGGASVAAFGERLFPYSDSEELIEFPREQARALLELEPALRSPLTRARMELRMQSSYHMNTGMAFGLSTLEGYWHAPYRYLRLVLALQGEPFSPTYLAVEPSRHENPRVFRALAQLYNVCCSIGVDGKGALFSRRQWPPSAGEAWFAPQIKRFATFERLTNALLEAGDHLGATARRELWVTPDDPLTRSRPLPADQLSATCRQARVRRVEAELGRQVVRLEVDVPAQAGPGGCALALAMNFAETFVVTGRRNSSDHPIELRTLPAYGALLGVLVPGGISQLTVEARPLHLAR